MTKRLVPLGTRQRMAAHRTTPFGEIPPVLDDLDILVALYGRSAPRAMANAITFAKWHEIQSPMPRVLVAWCYRDGDAPAPLESIPDYPWLHKIRLPEYDTDDGLMRKEGLLNYLLRDHATAPYVLTIDADVWSCDRQWFRKIRDKLAEDPDHVVQCYSYFRDTLEGEEHWAWGAQDLERAPRGECNHPGLGWAFSRQWADAHGDHPPFNPWHIAGSGDCAFVLEHFADHSQLSRPYTSRYEHMAYFQRVWRRSLPAGTLAHVEVEVWHQNHTNRARVPSAYRHRQFADRAYEWSRRALNGLGNLGQYLYLDHRGVPTFHDSRSPFALMIGRKPDMQDLESLDRVMGEEFGQAGLPGLPESDQVTLWTLHGIGDHLMLLGIVNRLHRERPETRIRVRLTRKGLEPWFRAACPTIEFTEERGQKVFFRHGYIPRGEHAVTRYGATVEDIRLPVPTTRPSGPLRIGFVTEHEAHLQRKVWPHWDRLAELVRERYGVEPIWIGRDVKAEPIHTLPELFASLDLIVCTEGMGAHLSWAIRRRAVVLVSGAVGVDAFAYPGWHTTLRGRCCRESYCRCYMSPQDAEPQCRVECMSSITPEVVLASMTGQLGKASRCLRN